MGLLGFCLEMSQGGKHSACNGTNTPARILVDFEFIQKLKIPFSIQFLSNGRSEIFLDKQDSDRCPSRCGSTCFLCACVQASVYTDVAFPPCKTLP